MPSQPSHTPPAATADVDDDLDDLDDLVPSFTAPPPPPAAAAPIRPAAASVADADDGEDELSDEAFAAELAKGMESMLRELNVDHSASDLPQPKAAAAGGSKSHEAQVEHAWERAFEEALRASGSMPSDGKTAATRDSSHTGHGAAGKDFQSTIRETMDRLKSSEAAPEGADKDPLEALLASLGMGPAADGEEDSDDVLERMMDGLMSKDVLYEPMKELHDKYPPYLASPQAAALPPPQLHAYREQAKLVAQIVALFDSPAGAKGEDVKFKAEIQELMGRMQDLGSPPKEVMGDMPEMEVDENGMPKLPAGLDGPDGCVIC